MSGWLRRLAGEALGGARPRVHSVARLPYVAPPELVSGAAITAPVPAPPLADTGATPAPDRPAPLRGTESHGPGESTSSSGHAGANRSADDARRAGLPFAVADRVAVPGRPAPGAAAREAGGVRRPDPPGAEHGGSPRPGTPLDGSAEEPAAPGPIPGAGDRPRPGDDPVRTVPARDPRSAPPAAPPPPGNRAPGARFGTSPVTAPALLLEPAAERGAAPDASGAAPGAAPAAPVEASATAGAHQSEVHVHIGRIEVTAVREPGAPARDRARRRPTLPLDEYLARRGSGG